MNRTYWYEWCRMSCFVHSSVCIIPIATMVKCGNAVCLSSMYTSMKTKTKMKTLLCTEYNGSWIEHIFTMWLQCVSLRCITTRYEKNQPRTTFTDVIFLQLLNSKPLILTIRNCVTRPVVKFAKATIFKTDGLFEYSGENRQNDMYSKVSGCRHYSSLLTLSLLSRGWAIKIRHTRPLNGRYLQLTNQHRGQQIIVWTRKLSFFIYRSCGSLMICSLTK